MKRTIIPSQIGLLLLLCSCQLQAQNQEFKEQISKEFTLTTEAGRNTLALYNIDGAVSVQGYAGNKVVVEATKIIRADDAQTLETGKREAQLDFLQRNDSLIVYMKGPFDSRPNHNRNVDHQRIGYRYTFNYVVKVPYQLNLHLSTINHGAIVVQDVAGMLKVYNINGAITLNNVKGTTTAHTINGNLEATYAANPPGPSSYYTINGQIKVTYPANLAADIHFKSMHGELFTDFPNAQALPMQVVQNKQSTGNGTQYKITKDTAVRLGKGGKNFRFETLNGNVTIKQQPQ